MAVSMNGKVCLITGAGRGMGRVTATELARLGARVIIVDWEGEAGTRTRDRINQENPGHAEFVYCDMSSLAEVRALADRVQSDYPRLDVLINNAGITDPVRRVSVDGWEMHLATCHLGHFVLTSRLLDFIRQSAPARIISISSEAYKAGDGLDFDDLNNEKIWPASGRPSNTAAFTAYHRAKLCNLYFIYELHQRLQGSGVTANAISPGFFVNTTIYRNLSGVFMLGARLVFGTGTLFGLNTPERSAKTYVWLATAPELEGVSGAYFEHLKEKDTSELARRAGIRRRLWEWTEEVTAC